MQREMKKISQGVEILHQRLANQRLTRSSLRTPAGVVTWLGAVQSQDYAAAKWAVGLRGAGLTDAAIERAFDDGAILRTHVLRPTWHFVVPADIRWMLSLTAPRVNGLAASAYRKLELDDRIFSRSRSALTGALGGAQLTRAELKAVLERARIPCDSLRLGFLLMRAELDQVICSGARRGRHATYALFDERVPSGTSISREEALARLATRYFASHGPATLHDFAWWSGLTIRDARAGTAAVSGALDHEVIGDATYWHTPARQPPPAGATSVHLLPNFDEYLVAYRDRRFVTTAPVRDALANSLIVGGRCAGTWRRTLKGGSVAIDVLAHTSLPAAGRKAIAVAAERYGAFLNMRATACVEVARRR